jgi:5,10-methylenetetrahydromethanopterin reductase
MGLGLSCAFATSLSTPSHVALAERLGYQRAWLYDSPALYPDVWMTLAECAAATDRIGLGPGVLIPSLRHPLVTASAIAHLENRAPGRVMVGVGSGFTGRVAMGKRPTAWAKVAEYVTVVGELLAGRTTEWDGAAIRMLHADGFAPARPIAVPFVLGVSGPLGQETARQLGVGVLNKSALHGFPYCGVVAFGTVVGDSENPLDDRVMAAAGHAVAVGLHGAAERIAPNEMSADVARWLDAYADVPAGERHLAMHDLHLVGVTDRDRPHITADSMRKFARTRDEWLAQFAHMAAAGAHEVVYQPAGPDIPGELERFAELVHRYRSA